MKKWTIILLSLSLIYISGCEEVDEAATSAVESNTPTTPTTTTTTTTPASSDDVNDVKALNAPGGTDPHNLIPLYGSLQSFADLPVNFEITSWSRNGIYCSVPEGEPHMDSLPGDHMQARRGLAMAFVGNNLVHIEDFAGTWSSALGESYGHAEKLLIIHLKEGRAVSRTRLSNSSDF
ncbi:MAG: hypothetical protein ACD_79C01370G0001 [uncultured bacterium]|nr:MAG: hypothetical protein ACD_79C01370G0001 [uncultured bacterium]